MHVYSYNSCNYRNAFFGRRDLPLSYTFGPTDTVRPRASERPRWTLCVRHGRLWQPTTPLEPTLGWSVVPGNMGPCAIMKAKDKLFVVTMCLVLVTLTSNYAIMVTFFPLYAKNKGMSRNAVSMIFTSFSIANLLMSMIAGSLASAFGRRAVLIWGVLQVSGAGCLIGFTPEMAQDDITLMCWLFTGGRALQGAGVALARLSIFAVLSDAFPDNRGLIIGSAVSMIALGFMIGPPVGGGLYALAGFRLPFVFLSVLCPVCTAPMLLLWPRAHGAPKPEDSGTQGLAAADSAAASDQAAAMSSMIVMDGDAPMQQRQEQRQEQPQEQLSSQSVPPAESPTQRPSLRQLLRLLPLDVFVVSAIAVVFESKWAMWDIFVVEWLVDEFALPIPTAALHISIVATAFALGCPVGGSIGDRLGDRRMHMVVVLLAALFLLYLAMGPWQLGALAITQRRALLYVYLVSDGAMSTLIEPQLMPEMLRLAEQQSRADGGAGPNEHLTNFVTTFSQFGMNAGAVIGPFVAVPLIDSIGFRGALASWGTGYATIAALTALRYRYRDRRNTTARRSSLSIATRTAPVELRAMATTANKD